MQDILNQRVIHTFGELTTEGETAVDTENLRDLVRRYHENKEFITNEETAKMALVVPFVRALGYDPNSPREVRLEYCAAFAQGDGKRFPDRMDFAIFDKTGQKALMVIETKPLGTNLQANSLQLARYISQLPDLHFGIITDGCHYLFFGDLESPNCMDKEPFFAFALDDVNTDWSKVAKFLAKFSRDAFNAETLVTDAEDSRYRQAIIDKLVEALRNPANDDEFLRWVTKDVYKGKRTESVMRRLGDLAKESVEPAILRLMSSDFLEKLKDRMNRLQEVDPGPAKESLAANEPPAPPLQNSDSNLSDAKVRKTAIVTTEEELEFFSLVSDICVQAGFPREDILWRDTTNYFNVSYKRPTRWFVRFFSLKGDQKALVSHVPVQTVSTLCSGFRVEEAPSVFGTSRIYFSSISQTWALKEVILASLNSLESASEEDGDETGIESVGMP